MIKRILGLAMLAAALAGPAVAYAAAPAGESCPAGCSCCPCPGC
jgi:hypothetical protein